MNSRQLMIQIHLILAALFMPLLLMMPLTGSLYILGSQGDQVKTEAFKIQETAPSDEKEREQFFRDQFSKQGIDFDFQYIRATKTDFVFRPTSRLHYVATIDGDQGMTVFKIEPNLLKRMIEVHKGHGPLAMRWFEALFGLALILTTLSGLWLAWTVKKYRVITLTSFSVGVVIIALCLI